MKEDSNLNVWIVRVKVGASFNQDGWYTTLSRLTKDKVLQMECSCTHGHGKFGLCAHKAVHVSVLQDMRHRPDELLFSLKTKKSGKLEGKMRARPLENGVKWKDKLWKIIPLDKRPLSHPHRIYCLCQKPERQQGNVKDAVHCEQCEEWYHPECMGMSTEDYERLCLSNEVLFFFFFFPSLTF